MNIDEKKQLAILNFVKHQWDANAIFYIYDVFVDCKNINFKNNITGNIYNRRTSGYFLIKYIKLFYENQLEFTNNNYLVDEISKITISEINVDNYNDEEDIRILLYLFYYKLIQDGSILYCNICHDKKNVKLNTNSDIHIDEQGFLTCRYCERCDKECGHCEGNCKSCRDCLRKCNKCSQTKVFDDILYAGIA